MLRMGCEFMIKKVHEISSNVLSSRSGLSNDVCAQGKHARAACNRGMRPIVSWHNSWTVLVFLEILSKCWMFSIDK